MSKIEIEIVDDNTFNKGWLMYLLGMDRPRDPEPDVSDHSANGWDMGLETRSLAPVRHVFVRQHDIDRPQYVVREVTAKPEPVVTNVGPDQQDEAKAIAKEHAAKVAGVDQQADVAEGEWAPAPRKKRE